MSRSTLCSVAVSCLLALSAGGVLAEDGAPSPLTGKKEGAAARPAEAAEATQATGSTQVSAPHSSKTENKTEEGTGTGTGAVVGAGTRNHRHKPKIIFGNGRKKNKLEVREHVALSPSSSFVSFFRPWQLKIGRVSLLQNTVSDLIKIHPDCRVIPAQTKKMRDIVACSNPRTFGAEGDEVVFDFLESNDVLIGAEYFFTNEDKARAFATLVAREMAQNSDTFAVFGTSQVDSPLFKVSVQKASDGSLVRITPYLREDINDFETFGREGLRNIAFGTLVIGKTRRQDISQVTTINWEGVKPGTVCYQSSALSFSVAEYIGQCFEFPYESHYQVNFDPESNVIESVILTPLSVLTSSLVETALTEKYGQPKFCEKVSSPVQLVKNNRTRKYHAVGKTDPIRNKNSMVYAGTCEEPVVFTVEDRYVLKFDRLNAQRIEREYFKRKAENQTVIENNRELQRRQTKLKNFF